MREIETNAFISGGLITVEFIQSPQFLNESDAVEFLNISATVDFRLLPGQTYEILIPGSNGVILSADLRRLVCIKTYKFILDMTVVLYPESETSLEGQRIYLKKIP